MPLIDIIFTATSATCVTGLSAAPITEFTLFGKWVIIILIQVGGLGLVTLSFFIASLFLNLGLATRFLAGTVLEFQFWSRVRQFLMLIIGVTFTCEAIGTIILYSQLRGITTPDGRFFTAMFHSISAFCHAGVALFPDNVLRFQTSPVTLVTLSILMLCGSIGFIVWYDLARICRTLTQSLFGKRQMCKMTLHSKIAISSTIALVFISAFVIWHLESSHSFTCLNPSDKIVNAFFTSVAARGPGFNSIAMGALSPPVLFILMLLMFVGASPGSTGSGIKNTSFVVFIATILSILRSRDSVEIAGRRIPHDQVFKVMAIVALALFWVFVSTFILLISESNLIAGTSYGYFDIMFEAISAFGTCGLSTGITPQLSIVGKSTIIITMLVGRIGALTLALALRQKRDKVVYQYPEERIMIG